ncbi:MAG: glycosyltransferase family 2 protein [Nitrospirae bacterium]|jgi:glycosyltransferase involved in cell wall biosynthesis|nr:glycosyltransferase family 2 protein [Nitrospirota bacterium]
MKRNVPLSVILCTYNRANYLKMVLDSILHQTFPTDMFEIVIIDDGSVDDTKKVVESFKSSLPIFYFYQNNAGLASARNHGIYASNGDILLFLDDDDIASPSLFEEHIKTHRKYQEENVAVLHYTTWDSGMLVTPLMHFVTEVGCFLFSYPHIKHGEFLDYTYFWGGRTSCKRSFLLEHGVFNPIFKFGCEDIELGYRLSKQGLKVFYNSKAISRMIRPITFDDFCNRLMKQGKSQYIFSTLHNDPNVRQWAEIDEAEEMWKDISLLFDAKVNSARQLDRLVELKRKYGFDFDEMTKILLYKTYWWVFKACKFKGIIEAKEAGLENQRKNKILSLQKQSDNNENSSACL